MFKTKNAVRVFLGTGPLLKPCKWLQLQMAANKQPLYEHLHWDIRDKSLAAHFYGK